MIVAVVLGVALWASPSVAQTGQVKGKVVDVKNQPVEGAEVTIETTDGMGRKYKVKTEPARGVHPDRSPARAYKITADEGRLERSLHQRDSACDMPRSTSR